MMKRFYQWPIYLIFLVVSCGCDSETTTRPELSLAEMYHNAIIDAMEADEDEIDSNLVAITKSNQYLTWNDNDADQRVLVVTLTKYPGSYTVGDTDTTWWGDTWVTVVPEMKDWFDRNAVAQENAELRAKQLLGLPPDDGSTHCAEFWVSPDDLFRPAPDNEITDRTAGLDFPAATATWYKEWFNANIIYSYFPMRYPWTRLGYTYDWGNEESEIGLSEFVVMQNARIVVESVSTTLTYLNY